MNQQELKPETPSKLTVGFQGEGDPKVRCYAAGKEIAAYDNSVFSSILAILPLFGLLVGGALFAWPAFTEAAAEASLWEIILYPLLGAAAGIAFTVFYHRYWMSWVRSRDRLDR